MRRREVIVWSSAQSLTLLIMDTTTAMFEYGILAAGASIVIIILVDVLARYWTATWSSLRFERLKLMDPDLERFAGGTQRMHAEKSCSRFPNFVAWVDLVPAGRKQSQPLKCERHRAHVECTTHERDGFAELCIKGGRQRTSAVPRPCKSGRSGGGSAAAPKPSARGPKVFEQLT